MKDQYPVNGYKKSYTSGVFYREKQRFNLVLRMKKQSQQGVKRALGIKHAKRMNNF